MNEENNTEVGVVEDVSPVMETALPQQNEEMSGGSGLFEEGGVLADGWTSRFEGAEGLSKYKTFDDLVKGAVNMSKLIGKKSDAPRKPGDGATPEEVAAWNAYVGVPERAEDYPVPDGFDAERYKEVAAVAHGAGITPAQMAVLARHEAAACKAAADAERLAYEKAARTAKQYFVEQWGADYEGNIESFRAGLKDMGLDTEDPDLAGMWTNTVILEALWEKVSSEREGLFPEGGVSRTASQGDVEAEIMSLLKRNHGDMSSATAGDMSRYNDLLAAKARLRR